MIQLTNERANEWTIQWMEQWMRRSGLVDNGRPAADREQIQGVARWGGESLNPEPPEYNTRAGLRKPRETAKFQFRYESLKS